MITLIVRVTLHKTPVALSQTTNAIFKIVSAESSPDNYKVNNIAQNTSPKAFEYIKSANHKYEKQDYRGALSDYSRAIQINPSYAEAYNNRGFLKADKLSDTQGGLTDLNRAIQISPSYASAYANRGYVKASKPLPDNQGALADYNRAIQLDPNDGTVYGNRGLLKYDRLNDKAGGIADTQQAAKLFKQQGSMELYQTSIKQIEKWKNTIRNSRQ